MKKDLIKFFSDSACVKKYNIPEHELLDFITTLENDYCAEILSTFVRQIEKILTIDPNRELKELISIAAEYIVKILNAEAATIRLFDTESLRMHTFGSYGVKDDDRITSIPVQGSIAGSVISENRSILVSNIKTNPQFRDKTIIKRKGVNSLIGVPLRSPGYEESGGDIILGSLQIYYKENNREFTKLEVLKAEVLARRVSYVLAKKKILDLKKLNDRKEKIVDKIFIKISNREGIKLKDFFILMMPELDEFLHVQSCSLFTVSENLKHIYLEAAYPLDMVYHDPHHVFSINRHPYFKIAVQGPEKYGDMPYERLDKSYVLIKDPQKSEIVSPGMKKFTRKNKIHSILLVPLKVDETARHMLSFYATDFKKSFSDEEIELLTFFGKEIMKASKMEFLGDMLHDFKNPAIAVAGLAARGRKLLEQEDINPVRTKLISYLDIIAAETVRLQDMSLSLTGEGREERIDLGKIAQRRFLINDEAIRELKRKNIRTESNMITMPLYVYCPVFGLERILDNLLSNATKAIPEDGGVLAMQDSKEGSWACLTFKNTGEIPLEEIQKIHEGGAKGRGFNIIYRFIHSINGKIDITSENGFTKITIKLPLHEASV